MSLRFLHAADLHLDSPFEGLPARKAAVRRGEQRELLSRLAELVEQEKLQLVLLSGDLLDSDNTYYETGEELIRSLGRMSVPVFIAPGNHDYYSESSPYARLSLPDNVHVFRRGEIECVYLPELNVRVYGAAFTDKRSRPLLTGFHAAPKTAGQTDLLCLHGDVGVRESIYNPVSEAELAASGVDYAAFGHVHKASGLCQAGKVWYSWPGCPEGRGFDETGEKGVLCGTVSPGRAALQFVPFGRRRYEILTVDVTDSEPLAAVSAALPRDTEQDIYRILLAGETEEPIRLERLRQELADRFYALELRDQTRMKQDIWARCGDDSLRGLFLQKMRQAYDTADDENRRKIEQAVRFGLAAMDNREM